MKVKSIQFRFKSPAVTASTPANQSLFVNIDKTDTTQFAIVLEHTSSLISGSYNGSIPSPYSKYGTLKFIHESIGASASVYLPFLDEGWWSVMLTQEDAFKYTLYAANKLYDGVDGNTIGFSASSSFTGSDDFTNASDIYFPGSGSTTALSTTYVPFDGGLQELRYFTETVTQQQFDAYTQNPNSIEGFDNLSFRASLGGELYKGTSSIHPGIGTANVQDSFNIGSDFTMVSGGFDPNYETILVDQVLGGVKNRVSNKIKKTNLILPTTSTVFNNIPTDKVLSSGLKIQQNLEVSQSSTRDVNYTETALSPQNEINDDINASFGFFNIGDYIGETLDVNNNTTNYPTLQALSNNYFTKYISSYNYKDYVRLAKYYDNAVFQMVKDFVPVRTGIATGVVVKQHLLERNRVRPAQVSLRDETISGSIKPQSRNFEEGKIQVVSGGAGGSVNKLTGSDQSWTNTYNSPLGLVTQVESSQYEFFNGEYSGSNLPAKISHSINETPLLNNISANRTSTYYQDVDYSSNSLRPVNITLIQSGSAYPATVPDSNYTAARSINPRYLGSKNTGELNYSESFADNSIQTGYPADRQTPWFAHFNGINNSAELGYNIGGNVNITELINAETGDRILLTSENKNLDFIGQLFKNGDRPSIAPATVETILEGAVEIEATGELYQTIFMKSGSAAGTSRTEGALSYNYSSTAINPSQYFAGVAVTQSVVQSIEGDFPYIFPLSQTSSGTSDKYEEGWMDLMTLPPGHQNYPSTVQGLGNIYIYNKKTGEHSQEHLNTVEETYLPLQREDFIRVGSTSSIDVSSKHFEIEEYRDSNNLRRFNIGPGTRTAPPIEALGTVAKPQNLTPFISQSTGFPFNTSASVLTPLSNADGWAWNKGEDDQNFRIIRRIPTEFYVLVKKKPAGFSGEGLLLPENFDKRYNARQVAINLNIIQTT